MTETEEVQHKLDIVTAVRLAVAAVKKRGAGYVYANVDRPFNGFDSEACYNWHQSTSSPGCIVGQILYDFGLDKDRLIENQGSPAIDFSYVYDNHNNDSTSYFLSEIQRQQDKGIPWGPAVAKGLGKINYLGLSKKHRAEIDTQAALLESLIKESK